MKFYSLLICSLFVLAVMANRRVYISMKGFTVQGGDIKSTGITNVDELRKFCDDTPGCVAFTSTGVLKNATAPRVYQSGTVWLAKESTSFAQEPDMPIWPMPLNYTHGTLNRVVLPTLSFSSNEKNSDMDAAFERYAKLMFGDHSAAETTENALSEVIVNVKDYAAVLEHGVDESYTLNIPSDSKTITIEAVTLYGAYHALESLSQLVFFDRATETYMVRNTPWIIEDAPFFPHRGLLVDSTRHFLPVPGIKRIIDSLTHSKFNVMHWHISDNEAFVIQSHTYPHLWETAYTDSERYTQNDIKDIVEYARQRGIRILPEIDIPGHMKSWCNVYPEVCPSETCLEPIDPSNENAFNLIDSVVGEFSGTAPYEGLFPEGFFHLGGDEVDTKCWSQTEHISKWMREKGYTTTTTYKYTVDRGHEIVKKRGRTPINWEEVITHIGSSIDKDAIIQIWLGGTSTLPIINTGHRVIISKKWYLDDLNNMWDVFYNNDPLNGVTDPEKQKMVLGGEACMWAETVDLSDWFNTVWPRAAAVAERLWTTPERLNVVEAESRLMHFRGLLVNRGYGAAPVLNKLGRDAPNQQSSYFWQ